MVENSDVAWGARWGVEEGGRGGSVIAVIELLIKPVN